MIHFRILNKTGASLIEVMIVSGIVVLSLMTTTMFLKSTAESQNYFEAKNNAVQLYREMIDFLNVEPVCTFNFSPGATPLSVETLPKTMTSLKKTDGTDVYQIYVPAALGPVYASQTLRITDIKLQNFSALAGTKGTAELVIQLKKNKASLGGADFQPKIFKVNVDLTLPYLVGRAGGNIVSTCSATSIGESFWSKLVGNDIFYNLGKVSIGTTSTDGMLKVESSETSHVVGIKNSNSNGWSAINIVNDTNQQMGIGVGGSTIGAPTGNAAFVGPGIGSTIPMVFLTQGIERARIENNGLLGIGTTTPQRLVHIGFTNTANDGTNGRLVLENFGTTVGSSAGVQLRTGHVDAPLGIQFANDPSNRMHFHTMGFAGPGTYGGYFYTFDNGASTPMVIKYPTGNVGIGTTTPDKTLHAVFTNNVNDGTNGRVVVENAGTGGAAFAARVTNSAQASGIQMSVGPFQTATNRGAVVYDHNFERLSFFTNSANWIPLFVMTKTGYLGIGTATPSYQLELTTDSAAKPGSTTWTIASDARLKDIRAPFSRGIESLMGLHPVFYHYKKDNPLGLQSDKEFVGLVAQDVQKSVPESVQTDKKGFLHVSSDAIIWTILNSVKELFQRWTEDSQRLHQKLETLALNEQLESAKLKNEIKILKAELKEKNNQIEFFNSRLSKLEQHFQNQ